MKQHLLLIAMAFGLTTGTFAQDKEENNKNVVVPAATKTAFVKTFPGASKVKWEKENADYEVNFVQAGEDMSAVFNAAGALQETEVEIKVSQLPATVIAYLKEHYKGVAVKEAAKITKANGDILYEAVVNKKDVLFDANGKFLKEAKD